MIVWSPERDPEPVYGWVWPTLLLCAWGLVLAWVAWENVEAGRVIEVELDPVTVTMDDPLPCATEPRIRLLYQELGVLCREDTP